MKARELAELLLQYPDAEVITEDEGEYTRVDTAIVSGGRSLFFLRGNGRGDPMDRERTYCDVWGAEAVELKRC